MCAKFPADFPINLLPAGVKEEEIFVYRICRSGKVEEKSFLPTYLDELSNLKEFDKNNPQSYSLSTYEKYRDARKKLRLFSRFQPEAIIASGVTHPSCGLVLRTKEWTEKNDSHVDWWLYEGALPHQYFDQVKEETNNE